MRWRRRAAATRFALAQTICRHEHPFEWSAPKPREDPCLDCKILALKIAEAHLIHPREDD